MKSKSSIIILCFAITYIVWGSTYMINVLLLRQLAPFFLAGCRFSIAGILLFIIYFITTNKANRERLSSRQWYNAILIGILFLTIGNGAMIWALQYMGSGYAALLISTQPLVVLLLNQFVFRSKTNAKSYIGVAISIVGVIILVSKEQNLDQEHFMMSSIAIVIALLCWGWGSIYIGKDRFPKNYILNTGIQMMIGGPLLLLISVVVEDGQSLSLLSNYGWGYFTYLVIFGSIMTFTAFNYLLINVSPEKVVTNTYVNPIVAVLLGAIFLEEQITIYTMLGGVLMLAGVYAILNVKYGNKNV